MVAIAELPAVGPTGPRALAERSGAASPAIAGRPLINLNVPSQYESIIADDGRKVTCVEVCALRTRVPDSIVMDLMRTAEVWFDPASAPKHNVIIASEPDKLKFRLRDWCDRAGIECSARLGAIQVGSTNFWFLRNDALDDLPVTNFERLLIADAHAVKSETAKAAIHRCLGRCHIVGRFSDREHWFYLLGREPGARLHRVAYDVVANRFADQAREVDIARQKFDKPTFRRSMELEDVDLSTYFGSFARFSRQRLWIRDRESNVIPFVMTHLQKVLLAKKRLGRMRLRKQGKPGRYLILKPRREGVTTVEQGLNYQDTATRTNRMNVTLAHLAASTSRIFRIAKLMQERDPYAPTTRSVGNASRIDMDEQGSMFFIGTAGSVGFGRGDTLNRVHGSEVSKWCPGPNQHQKVDDIIAGLTQAASNGEVTLETTACGLDWFYEQWVGAKEGKNDWVPILLRWFESPFNLVKDGLFVPQEILETLSTEEKELVAQHGLSLNQLAWRRARIRELGNLFLQEYPEDDIRCFLRSGVPYFDMDVLELLVRVAQASKPVREETVPGGRIVYFEEPRSSCSYVAGSDTSEGLAHGDAGGTYIVDRKTGRDIAYVYGQLNIEAQATLGLRLCREYDVDLWGIERNNTSGGAVVQKVVELGGDDILFQFREGRYGWSTDAQTRPILCNRFRDYMNAVADDPRLFTCESQHNANSPPPPTPLLRSPELLQQCMSFRLQSTGKYEHDPNASDDLLFCRMIANEMREHAANVPGISYVDRYGRDN